MALQERECREVFKFLDRCSSGSVQMVDLEYAVEKIENARLVPEPKRNDKLTNDTITVAVDDLVGVQSHRLVDLLWTFLDYKKQGWICFEAFQAIAVPSVIISPGSTSLAQIVERLGQCGKDARKASVEDYSEAPDSEGVVAKSSAIDDGNIFDQLAKTTGNFSKFKDSFR